MPGKALYTHLYDYIDPLTVTFPPPQLVPPAQEGMSGHDDTTVSWNQKEILTYTKSLLQH